MLEASLYDQNSFLTLTYSGEHLPPGGALVKKHFQDFMKRLRKRFSDQKIRYYMCGEYGDEPMREFVTELGRPHFHACVFNFDFPDKKFSGYSKAGEKMYASETLDRVWGKGRCWIGDVTFESAAYTARYMLKKVNGDDSEEHYTRVDKSTGEVHVVPKEFATQSRRPGIGKPWLDLWKEDIYPSDFVVIRGRRCTPPKYFDEIVKLDDPEMIEALKEQRVARAKERRAKETGQRLWDQETVKLAQADMLKRE